MVSKKSKGLFHKAISMSGYTTSIKPSDAYSQSKNRQHLNILAQKLKRLLVRKIMIMPHIQNKILENFIWSFRWILSTLLW